MGNETSSLATDNDFELVVRVAKELDETLKNEFGAEHHRQLGDKIEFVNQQKRNSFSHNNEHERHYTTENIWC